MGFICLYVLIQKSGQKTAKSHLCALCSGAKWPRRTLDMYQVGIHTIYYHILVIGDHLATIGGVQFQVLHLGHFWGWTSLT